MNGPVQQVNDRYAVVPGHGIVRGVKLNLTCESCGRALLTAGIPTDRWIVKAVSPLEVVCGYCGEKVKT